MKKNYIIILAAVVVIAIVGISLIYPPADKSDSAGTIGKVNKYRKSRTSQDDIVLRNDFLQDTTALKSTIDVLDSYQKYYGSMDNEIKDWEKSLKKLSINEKKIDAQLKQLNLLAVYIDNNLSTVAGTRELLNKYYTKDTTDMSIDVQNNLIRFQDFTNNLEEKCNVIDSLFVNLNNIIDKNKLDQLVKTKKEAEELVKVREKMLGGIFFLAFTTGNEARLNMAFNSKIMNAQILNKQLNNALGPVLLIASKGKLGARNMDKLNLFLSRESLGVLFSNAKNGKANLGNSMNASLAAALQGKKLGLFLDKEKLGIQTKGNAVMFANKSLGLHNMKKLGNGFWAKGSFGAFANFARSLNMYISNKEHLGLGLI